VLGAMSNDEFLLVIRAKSYLRLDMSYVSRSQYMWAPIGLICLLYVFIYYSSYTFKADLWPVTNGCVLYFLVFLHMIV